MAERNRIQFAPYANENLWRHVMVLAQLRMTWRLSEYAVQVFFVVVSIFLQRYWEDAPLVAASSAFVYALNNVFRDWQAYKRNEALMDKAYANDLYD